MATERGLAGLAFSDPGEESATLADMRGRWPKANYVEDMSRHGAARRAHLRSPSCGGRTGRCASS